MFINKIHPNVKFTTELENTRQLPLLDLAQKDSGILGHILLFGGRNLSEFKFSVMEILIDDSLGL